MTMAAERPVRESGLSADPARQQEIEPDQTRVMGFDGQAGRQAQNANRHKALPQKAPDGHRAKADHETGRIASTKNLLAVGRKQTNQKQ